MDKNPTTSGLRTLLRRLRAIDAASLPPPVLERVRLCLLDMLACSLEAADLPWSTQARAVAAEQGGEGPATVIGTALRTTAAEAAFANGVQAHGLVQEDMHPPSTSHIGVVVLPTALAMAERCGSSGAEFVAAVVAGYEAMGRLGRVLVDRRTARIFRPTGWIGPFGAAVAASRLLRLDEDQAVNAAAFACNQAAGLNEWAYAASTEVFFHGGFAARSGITAAWLARHGARGAESTLEGPAGLAAALGNAERLQLLTQEAEQGWEILEVYHKPAPVCHFAQTPCQAAVQLAQQDALQPEDIERVEVRVSAAAAAYPGCDQPGPLHSLLEAKSSIQHAVAAGLLHGAVTERRLREFDDGRTAALRGRIELVVDESFTRASPGREGAEVTVLRHGARQASRRLERVQPLDDAGVLARFREVATRCLGAAAASEIESATADLRALPRLDPLTRLFRTGESS